MHYRKSKGLNATSLDLGLMRGIGYVEENEDAAAHTSSLKFVSLPPHVDSRPSCSWPLQF